MDSYAPGVAGRIIPSALAHLPRDPAAIAALRERWTGRLVAGNVAALVERDKGQRMIIGAARRLVDSHPELLFVLLGSGPDESVLRSAAAGLGNVVFEGHRDDVGDYLAAFDLFVFPSRSEGLGSTLLDAMDCGLPVVATRVGGIPDVVLDGETGRLVEAEDEAGFAAAIAELARDPARREAMSRAARARAREFEPDRMTEAYARLYRDLARKAAA
jgi:glycosyltransferase involved in cell wall biosynthesis